MRRSAAFIVGRVIVLTILLVLCYAVAGGVLGLSGDDAASEEAGDALLPLLTVCFSSAAILAHLILRSRWTGWRLMVAVFVVFYGVTTFMAQIETAVFVTHLPPGMLPRLFVMGAVIAAPFSVLAVLLLGKGRSGTLQDQPNLRLVMPVSAWAWKLAVIAVVYVTLYFTFGYFIAWQEPAVREYYGGIDEGSFTAHMAAEVRQRPWLIPFQMLRALCWTLLALPVVRMMKGQWQETALALALLFGVLMNAQLLLPNPFMPEAVRMAHLVETASSNVIFGLFVGWLLTEHPTVPHNAIAPGRARL